MNYIFTDHARLRMEQRDIGEDDIISTIEQPDVLKRSFGKRMLAQKKIREKKLEVVFIKKEKRIVVVTNYWLEEEI